MEKPLFKKSIEFLSRPGVLVMVVVLLLLITIMVWVNIKSVIENEKQEQFDIRVTEAIEELHNNMSKYEEAIRAQQSFFMSSETVTNGEWNRFVDQSKLLEKYPGLHVTAYAKYFRETTLHDVQETVFSTIGEYTIWPGNETGDFAVNIYVRPEQFQIPGIGYNHFAEPNRKEAMLQGRNNGEITVTNKLTLITDSGEQKAGFIIYVPVYTVDKNIETVEARQKSWQGSIIAAFYVEEMVAATNLKLILKDIHYSIYDATIDQLATVSDEETDRRLLFTNDGQPLLNLPDSDKLTFKEINILGKTWTMVFVSTDNFASGVGDNLPSLVLLFGFIITLFITFVLISLSRGRKQAEKLVKVRTKELEELTLLQQSIFDSADSMIITTDERGIIKTFNKASEDYLGYKADEVIGIKTPLIFHDLEEIKRSSKESSKILNKKVPSSMDYFLFISNYPDMQNQDWTYIRNDGSRFPVKLRVTNLVDNRGRLMGLLGIAIDNTKQKEYEQELVELRDQALAASIAKSEFLAVMSHEIRTPMNAIMGMAELLSETSLTEEQEEFISIFRSSSENLMRIINDILDLSKVEAGHIEITSISFPITKIIEDGVEIFASKAHQKGLELMVHLDTNVPDCLKGDPDRIIQVLSNLVSNAIKFTEKGEVLVNLSSKWISDKDLILDISVSDTGLGISKENIEKVFDSFTQVDSSMTRKKGGTGLGLTIAKRLVEKMGGTINISSEFKKGSTFSFTIPLEVSFECSLKNDSNLDNLSNQHVLIVDDVQTNRFILREMIKEVTTKISEAESGEQALLKMKEISAKGERFALIIVDCRMPGMDGFELVEKIKKGNLDQETLILMLTSDNRYGDLKKVKALDIHSYLLKPVSKYELFAEISGIQQKSKAVVQGCENKEEKYKVGEYTQTDQTGKLLLVEDSIENRKLIEAYLKGLNYTLDIAMNGQEAIDKYLENDYDLILMDIQMPIKDGYTATKEIREIERREKRKATPIIALTAHALKEDERKSLEAGLNAHLTKPIKKSLLINEINKYLRRK